VIFRHPCTLHASDISVAIASCICSRAIFTRFCKADPPTCLLHTPCPLCVTEKHQQTEVGERYKGVPQSSGREADTPVDEGAWVSMRLWHVHSCGCSIRAQNRLCNSPVLCDDACPFFRNYVVLLVLGLCFTACTRSCAMGWSEQLRWIISTLPRFRRL
jgi:hypothetical protein